VKNKKKERKKKDFSSNLREPAKKTKDMGTVLSFSPRESHPIYSTHHHHRGSGTMSTSSSADFSLNNYAYEQMNNVKNRENCKTSIISNNNGSSLVLFGSSNSNIMNNNLTQTQSQQTNTSAMEERQADSARILSEKNAIEKNLKKHSLFINALSWKRLSASHGKKKLENYNAKNKSSSGAFRPPTLTDTVHPMVAVNEKNKNYQQQQIQFASNNNLNISNNNNNNLNVNHHIKDTSQSNIYFSPGPKSLLALDLQNSANNANLQHHQHNIEKLGPKIPLQLPLSLQSNVMHSHQQSQALQSQQQIHFRPGPRKTIIQVSAAAAAFFFQMQLKVGVCLCVVFAQTCRE
jgi:cyclin-dependent kinase 5 activator 1